MSFATAAFAGASSPAMKTTSRSSRTGREPLAKVFQPIVLKAFTRRAAGIRFATSSLDVLSPRAMTPPTALYGFIASITIFPAKDSASGSASIFRYGSARRTASPNLTASTTDVAFALGPIEDTNEANVDGPRELLSATWCPAFAKSFAAVPPMCPAPTTPILIPVITCLGRRRRPRAMDFRIPNYICFVHRKLQAAATDAPEPSWNGLTMETPEPRAPARRSRFGFSATGVSSQVVGLLLGAVGVAMVVSAAPLGIYSDRRGRKGLLLIGSAILPPSILVFAVTTDVRWMVLAALAAGVGEGAFLSSWNAIIADQTTVEQRNVAFALSFVLNNVFSGVGLALPFSFPFIQAQTGLSSQTVHVAALVLTDGLGFVMPVAFYFLLRDYRETIRTREARPKGMDWKPLLKFSGINGLIGLGAGFFIPLVPTWLFLKFAVPDTWSGPLLALSNVTIGLAATGSASLAKRYGPVRAIVMAQGLSTVFMFSLAFVTNAVAAAGLYMVRAALMNMSAPIGDSFLMGIVAPEQRGLASAVNSIVWRLPNSVTTILGGVLIAGGYYDIPIFLPTPFYLASIASFYVVFHSVRPSG